MTRVVQVVQGDQVEKNQEIVVVYHNRTKHRFEAYAKGPETLDWDSQPNPFRNFDGAHSFPLPLSIEHHWNSFHTVKDSEPVALDQSSLSLFLRHSMGLTAWKQYGPDKWSLRVNPSSGNLHPTETYVFLPQINSDLSAGLYHYNVEWHSLEQRAITATPSTDHSSFLLAFSSVTWREAWKYGERAFRYCQLDMGHALSSVVYAARALGWQVEWLAGISSDELESWLGLNRPEFAKVEKEIPECLLKISVSSEPENSEAIADNLELPPVTSWQGTPNILGERGPYKWPVVDQIAKVTEIVGNATKGSVPLSKLNASVNSVDANSNKKPFDKVVLQRRSAQRFLPQSISRKTFESLIKALFSAGQPIFNINGEKEPLVHFVVIVHRVEGVEPGIYCLSGTNSAETDLRKSFSKWDEWKDQNLELPDEAKLFQLTVANVQRANATLCCQQKIGSDCAVSIGFIVEFDKGLKRMGPQAYRYMHWQAGMLAHQLYLEATHEGIAATGIGCFFDDPWHELLGLLDTRWQFLYHIALGVPEVDNRITSLSGYYYLKD